MARAETSTTIKRPVEDVFSVISDIENNPKWASGVLEAQQTSPGPVGVGTTARTVSRFLGRRLENEMEISEYEPSRRFSWVSRSGPFPFRGSVTMEQVEDGTRVNATFEGEPAGFFKLAEPLIVTIAKRQFQGDLDNLKDLMEANAL